MKPPVDVKHAVLVCLLALATGSSADLGGSERAATMLERMNSALRSLDYEGTLVYLFDNRLETLHLVHRVDGGRIQERLLSLSGPVRAVTREHGRVTCVRPDGHPISVQSRAGRNLQRAERIDPAALADRYRIAIGGAERVAGRETDVITIEPRDTLRYGYRFHLDRETGLPLKSDLIDDRGEPIEQLMFTSITTQSVSADSGAALAPTPDRGAEAESKPGHPSRWRFDERPAGYEPAMHDVMRDPNGAEVEHFVFTDRLSAYSVYIEADTGDGLEGVTRIGAAHAAGRRIGDHQVTAVGEVPAATVEAAVAGVRLAEEDTR